MILFISFIACFGVSIMLETYIKGPRAKLFMMVILPLRERCLCFQIFS